MKTAGCKPRPQLPRDDDPRAETGSSEDPEGEGQCCFRVKNHFERMLVKMVPQGQQLGS